MKVIWKYEIPIESWFTLEMPMGAKIHTFQTQGDEAHIWAIVEPGREIVKRCFVILATGQEFIESPGKYLGTVQVYGGQLVWHLFEVKA